MVRNMSTQGARLEVANTFWIPNHFELEIGVRDLRQPVEVIWRDGSLLGVAFKDIPAALGKQGLDELYSLRLEREHLRRRVTQLSD